MYEQSDFSLLVRGVVRECKNALGGGQDGKAMENALETVSLLMPHQSLRSDSSKLLPAAISSHTLSAAQGEFLQSHYSAWLRFLLENYTVDWVKQMSRGVAATKMEFFFLHGCHHEALCTLGLGIKKYSGIRAAKCAALLEKFLEQSLHPLILEQCTRGRLPDTHPIWQELLVVLAALPDHVTGKMQQETSAIFYPEAYVSHLSQVLLAVLGKVHQRLMKGQDCSLQFVSMLLGKLGCVGYAGLLWSHILPELVKHVHSDFVWCRLCEKLITGVPDQALESVVLPLIQQCPSGPVLAKFLGSSVLTRHKLQFLLTQKFLFLRHYPQDQLLQTLLGYLAASTSTQHLLVQVFKRLLEVWGDGSSLRHTSYEQHFYLSRAIMVCIAYLPESQKKAFMQDYLGVLMPGVQAHLDSSSPATRRLGMVIAEALTQWGGQEHQAQLKFEYEVDEEVHQLQGLRNKPCDPDLEAIANSLSETTLVGQDATRKDEKTATDNSSDSELDSDDDLEPYDLSSDVKVNKVKKPVYLRECMEGLLSSEDGEKVEVCLRSAEDLVRKHATSAKEIAVEFTKIVLHSENKFWMSDFLSCRHLTLVALCCTSPAQVADYLTEQFYDRNYSMRQRIDILHVLAAAAQELSDPKSRESKFSKKIVPLNSTSIDANPHTEEDWKSVVQARIESKTRRFASGPTQPAPTVTANKFAPVAGHFVFPLLRHYDNQEPSVDLLGSDHLLLSRLVYTLGSLMYSTLHAPIATQIGASLLEFLWVVRYHPQPAVRQAVLYATSMVVLAVPNYALLTDLAAQITELKHWLQDVVEKDVDEECQTRGIQTLVLLENSLRKELGSAMT